MNEGRIITGMAMLVLVAGCTTWRPPFSCPDGTTRTGQEILDEAGITTA